jgi:hypothetical protein
MENQTQVEAQSFAQASQLTDAEALYTAKIAGSLIGKLCFGGAKLFKGTGWAIEKGTNVTTGALRLAADGVEIVGAGTSSFCYRQGDKLEAKHAECEADLAAIEAVEKERIAQAQAIRFGGAVA